MSEFSRTLIERSGDEIEGFADVYDRYRPTPPPELLRILMLVAQVARPHLVVDLGAGTGLSTRPWAERAEQVVGVEPNKQMVERARSGTHTANVSYLEAFAVDTGLGDASADIVTCAQAFHWMEPAPVLTEAARILRPGGVFAAYDYDVPPVVHPEVDLAFAEYVDAKLSTRPRLEADLASWPKEGHLERIRASGSFRSARELVCHGFDETHAARIVGLAESVAGPREALASDAPQVDQTSARLRATCHRVLGKESWQMVVCYRVRVGVK